jgi:uncharacterized damage-inducible protein DinB
MMTSLLADAIGHHIWATERVLDACATLTAAQLTTPVPGTYGPIIETLHHLVQADSYYLWIFTNGRIEQLHKSPPMTVDELRAAMRVYAEEYRALLAGEIDPDGYLGEPGDDSGYQATLGIRLAQVVHHGTDHRSQVCTGLTSLGITPPSIDLWDFGDATGRTRE